MFWGLVVIARLLKRMSECAFLPGFCKLMSLNDSYGIESAFPETRREWWRGGDGEAVGGDDEAVGGDELSWVMVLVVKYVTGIYLLLVASRSVGSWPWVRYLSNA